MRSNGFTLIELLIVVAIMGTLLSIATLQFNRYSKKAAMESEIRMLHADLMTVRAQAMYGRQPRSIIISNLGYSIYSSTEVSGLPVSRKDIKAPLIWNGASGQLDFDASGVLSNPGVGGRSICISESGNPAAVDSIVLSATRMQIGKRDEGGACASGNIKTQ